MVGFQVSSKLFSASALNGQQPFQGRPVTVRFQAHCDDPNKTDKSSKSAKSSAAKSPGAFTRFLAKQVANVYTRPGIIKKLVPQTQHLIHEKHLGLFEPIIPLSFQSLDGTPLSAKWLPALPRPVSIPGQLAPQNNQTIVMGHGYSADWRMPLELATKLREAGFNCLMFDFRAHGKSGGERTSIGFHEGLDIVAASQLAKTRFPKESERLFYYGHSMGAAAYMMIPESGKAYPEALSAFQKDLKGAVLDSGYYSFDEIANRFIKELDQVSGGNWAARKLVKPVLGGKFGDNLLSAMKALVQDYLKLPVNLFQVVPAQILSQSSLSSKPTLLMHGTKDQVTPFHHAVRVAETLATPERPQIRFEPLEGENHFNSAWKPVAKAPAYWTLERGNASGRIVQFVKGVPFAGRLKHIKTA